MSRQRAAPDLLEDETRSSNGILGMLGQIVSAHPSLAGGSVAFSVIFGFVAANALWHQPGQHPAPILKTRELSAAAAPVTSTGPATQIPGAEDVPARSVTTFRIERSDETPTASIPVPYEAPVSSPAPVAAARSAADPVLSRIQAILSDKGLYSGEIDGLMGPKSASAIRTWEKNNGYSQTGEATPALLAIMETAAAPVRAAEPVQQAAAPQSVNLARLEEIPTPAPKPHLEPVVTAKRTGEPVTVPAEAVEGPSELVRRIQSGLSNIAYADISVDGVAGAQTRAAIGAFEKHYRLPVTGQPNETVLNKLIEIGAL